MPWSIIPVMIPTQCLPASLTPLDVALAALLQRLEPVAPVVLPLAEALGCVAAGMLPLTAFPPCDTAVADGWACLSRNLVGASSYFPLPMATTPVWVEAGDAMPESCDCVISADSIDQTSPIAQALAEAIPGQGVRRAGGDIAAGSTTIAPGRRLRPLDLLVVRAAGLQELHVRHPRLRIVNVPAPSGNATSAQLILDSARAAGADAILSAAAGRDAASIARAIEPGGYDMLITVGGSGVGRTDAMMAALARTGRIVAHGIALQPGRTAAVAWNGEIPVIALPGAPDQALAAWWTLGLPVLGRLTGLSPQQPVTLPLARKIASSVGLTEIVLLEKTEGRWMPLALGELSLDAIARAHAWLAVPGGSEGFAAGTPVDAYMLRD
jgi:molybdopterin molybdotransferase